MSDSDNDNNNNDKFGFQEATQGEQEQQRQAETDPRDEIRVNTKDTYISVNSVRLFKLTELPLERLEACTVLEVRKNLVHQLVPFPDHLRAQLQELDLFDNKIKHIAPFFSAAGHPYFSDPRWTAVYPDVTDLSFAALRKLDLSYNQIRNITGLESLGGTLEELYLVENRIKTIEGVDRLPRLKLLELGGNQLRAVDADSLRGLTSLEQLWLGKNKISSLAPGCFAHCPNLRRLSLQANRLTGVAPGVFPSGQLTRLAELYLSENGFKRIENIAALRSLTLLDMSFNPIASLLLPAPTTTAPAATSTAAAGGAAAEPAAAAATTTVTEKKDEEKKDEKEVKPEQQQQQEQKQEQQPGVAKESQQNDDAGDDDSKKGNNDSNSSAQVVAAQDAPKAKDSEATMLAKAAALGATELCVANFPQLEEFWLTDGKLEDWKELALLAPFFRTLRTVYLERNPLERDRRYRDKVYQSLPFLEQIDSWPIVNKQNPEADRAIHRRA